MDIIIKKLNRAFNLTMDLMEHLRAVDLKLRLKDLPSNTIGNQYWCIIGARESFLKAVSNNGR